MIKCAKGWWNISGKPHVHVQYCEKCPILSSCTSTLLDYLNMCYFVLPLIYIFEANNVLFVLHLFGSFSYFAESDPWILKKKIYFNGNQIKKNYKNTVSDKQKNAEYHIQ